MDAIWWEGSYLDYNTSYKFSMDKGIDTGSFNPQVSFFSKTYSPSEIRCQKLVSVLRPYWDQKMAPSTTFTKNVKSLEELKQLVCELNSKENGVIHANAVSMSLGTDFLNLALAFCFYLLFIFLISDVTISQILELFSGVLFNSGVNRKLAYETTGVVLYDPTTMVSESYQLVCFILSDRKSVV